MLSNKRLALWRIIALSSGGLLLPHAVSAQEAKPAKLLFVSNRAGEKKLNIFTMNPDGSEQTNLTRSDALEFDPCWSPDHKKIAFVVALNPKEQKADIYVMSADGSNRTKLTATEPKTIAFSPAWSPDGKRIAYATMTMDFPNPKAALYTIDPDGKNNKKIGEGLIPVWTPDGKQIAYTALPKDGSGGGVPSLRIVGSDGTGGKELAARGLGASYSADGRKILYIGDGEGNQPDIYLMNADGSDQKVMKKTPDAIEFGAMWAADGKRIYFTGAGKEPTPRPKMQISLMDADGGNVKVLTTEGTMNVIGPGASLFLLSLLLTSSP